MKKPTAKEIREAKAAVEHAHAAWQRADEAATEAQRVLDARRREARELDAQHQKAKQRLRTLTLTKTQLAALAALRDGERLFGHADHSMQVLDILGLVTCESGFRGRRCVTGITPAGRALLEERGL